MSSSAVKKMLSNINNLKMFLDLNEIEAIHILVIS